MQLIKLQDDNAVMTSKLDNLQRDHAFIKSQLQALLDIFSSLNNSQRETSSPPSTVTARDDKTIKLETETYLLSPQHASLFKKDAVVPALVSFVQGLPLADWVMLTIPARNCG